MPSSETVFRCGMVALIGKPNVGKSTLLNAMVGQKVSIVSDKPQTTRRRVLGVANGDGYQAIFVDTPGIHEAHNRLGRSMVEQARAALGETDVVVYVADGSHHPGEVDRQIADLLHARAPDVPLILAMNKMDLLKAENVQRNVDAYNELLRPQAYMMTTATQNVNVDKLLEMIVERLPEGEALYDEDTYTDQSSRFLAAELVREKILRHTRQEVPHATAVLVEGWVEEDDVTRIEATIVVDKASQRAILIGKQGAFLKKIGTLARTEIEEMLGCRVFLQLHVKAIEGWRQSPRILRELEYGD